MSYPPRVELIIKMLRVDYKAKNKNVLYLFRLFGREAAHLRQFILGQLTSPGKKLYLDTKNNYDNYEQLRTRSGRFFWATTINKEWTIAS